MIDKSKKKIVITSLLLFLLLFQACLIVPNFVSAISYSNNTLALNYNEFSMYTSFDSWNETSFNLDSTDTLYLQDYTTTNFKITQIIIFNDSNDNGFFEAGEDNLTLHIQLNHSNYPIPNNQSIMGLNSIPGNLINSSAWNSTSNPSVTYAMHALAFQNPTQYQGVNFSYLETQFKINLTINNWQNWINGKLLLVMSITSALNFNKIGNSLISEVFDECPGPDVDDDEYKVQANWTFFQMGTLNSSLYNSSNTSISGSGGNWVVNFTFNKFKNLSFNGSKIVFNLGTAQNNLIFFVLFAVMLGAIIATTVIIYFTRERRNKFLDDIE